MQLESSLIQEGFAGLVFRDGQYIEDAARPGVYAFWKYVSALKVVTVDLREQVVDVTGQEMMTADNVTLRMNAVIAYHIADPLKSTTIVEDSKQALYREVQLALRAIVGTREIDAFAVGT